MSESPTKALPPRLPPRPPPVRRWFTLILNTLLILYVAWLFSQGLWWIVIVPVGTRIWHP